MYQHIQTLKNNQSSEIEDMLSDFLHQLKLENKKLENKVHHHTNNNATNPTVTKQAEQIHVKEQEKESNESSYEFPPIKMEESNDDQVETSLH